MPCKIPNFFKSIGDLLAVGFILLNFLSPVKFWTVYSGHSAGTDGMSLVMLLHPEKVALEYFSGNARDLARSTVFLILSPPALLYQG